MKLRYFLILIFFTVFICSCDINDNNLNSPIIVEINIVSQPTKTNYFINENIDLTGLQVEAVYDDNRREIINEYTVIYPDFEIGQNNIIIKYGNLETSFNVFIKESISDQPTQIEKEVILNFNDLSMLSTTNIDFNDFDLRFTDVKYGIRRDKDMMIIYDQHNFVETNIYGYEISVDEYGLVVDVGVNVSLINNGYVISGHGISSDLLKNVNIGDVCIFINENVYIYKNRIIDNRSKGYLKILDLKKSIELIEDVKLYNIYVQELNSIIIQYNNVNAEDNNKINFLYDYLCDMSDSINNFIKDEVHDYNYCNVNYNSMEQIPESQENYINFINYNEKLYYGGFRNQDTLVYYDKNNYRSRNSYGYEIAVGENNVIIDMNYLVDLPENGYILSGHGTGAEFIKNNLNIGNKVEITDTIILFYKDLGAGEYNNLIAKRNELVVLLNDHINRSIPHDYDYINRLMKYIDNRILTCNLKIESCYDVNRLAKIINDLEEYITTTYSQLIDHKVLETRGMWYYPFSYPKVYDDTSLIGVENTLDMFKEMGFNEIIILPFYGNYCLYDSRYFHYYEKLNEYSYGDYGNDYLLCFISEAHKRDITVNAFTQTFKCYQEGSKLFDESFYQVQYDGTLSKGQIYYYDICNDYVQENLINWYKELVTLYDFDKVEYDIIRYSYSNLNSFNNIDVIPENSIINDPGYTEYSMNKFMEMYGLEGDLKTLIRQSIDVRLKWLEFKENELIKFIATATNEMKNIKPNLVISAAVLNDYQNSKNCYLQDAKKWLELGIVDIIEPMVYSDDYSYVVDKINFYNNNFVEYDVRIGLSYGLTVNELIMQIEASSNNGYVLYNARDYLTQKHCDILKNSFHFEYVSEISSVENKKIVVVKDLIDKIENYYEIKNNNSYDELVSLLIEHDFSRALDELIKIDDKMMYAYIFNIIKQLEMLK